MIWDIMKIRIWIICLFIIILVTSCDSIPRIMLDESLNQSPTLSPEPSLTATVTPTATITPTATKTPIPPTVTPTPWSLETFALSLLNPGVTPVQYLEDTCSYLANRWGEGKSEPGTIVVPIMFHSIAKPGREIRDSSTITMAYFEYFMATAKELGFETIKVSELVDFLLENKEIPKRSMIMILDDRRPGVTELFMPYLEENGWTLTLGWPTTDATREELWERMESLADTGLLDIQSHGHDHIYIQSYTPLEEIEEEIYQPIEVIQEHFGTTAQAIIWPGGNFTQESIVLAREAGLELGFSVYSRGPLMFNWIPLGESEMMMDDPLMVLPRYWSTAADVALQQALEISEAAEEQAESVWEQEQLYYSLFCQSVESD